MGIEIVRVPPGFRHPTNDQGEPIPGAHHEALYYLGSAACTAYQLYENVTEGSPVSPVFGSEGELIRWLTAHGAAAETVQLLLQSGHAPSLVIQAGMA